jgi:hypothetical protein
MWFRFIAAVSLAHLAVAQPEGPKVASLSGTVVDAQDGHVLSRVAVCLAVGGSEKLCDETNARGQFELKDVPPGTYGLVVTRTGYFKAESASALVSAPITLQAGDTLRDISIPMDRAATISGHVILEDGEPFANLPVRLGRQTFYTETNDLGEYRFPNLRPGDYSVQAAVERSSYECANPPLHKPHAYIVNGGARDIHLEKGQQLGGVDLVMRDVPPRRISGRVTPQKGMLIGSLRLSGQAQRLQSLDLGKTDGAFALCGLISGDYAIEFESSLDGRKFYANSKFTLGDEDLTDLELTPEPSALIRGRIVATEGTQLDLNGTQIELTGWQTSPRIQKQPDGAFSIDDIFSGDYRAVLYGLPPGTYNKSLRIGNREVLDTGFTIHGGELIDDVVFTIGTNAGTLSGRVIDTSNQSLPGLPVVLQPDPQHADLEIHRCFTETDQNGSFVCPNLAPGPYRVIAWRKFPDASDWREELAAKGTKVDIPENGQLSVTLNVP